MVLILYFVILFQVWLPRTYASSSTEWVTLTWQHSLPTLPSMTRVPSRMINWFDSRNGSGLSLRKWVTWNDRSWFTSGQALQPSLPQRMGSSPCQLSPFDLWMTPISPQPTLVSPVSTFHSTPPNTSWGTSSSWLLRPKTLDSYN